MLTMNKSKLARNAAADTTRTVAVERVADNCVVATKFASQLGLLTGRPGHAARSLNIANCTQGAERG